MVQRFAFRSGSLRTFWPADSATNFLATFCDIPARLATAGLAAAALTNLF